MSIEGRGFKRNTIEKVIRAKINNWLKSINDDNLKKIIKENYILTGGAITSLLQGEQPNDYDLYFATRESAVKVAEYYLDKCSKEQDSKVKIYIDENVADRVKIVIKSVGILQGAKDNTKGYEYFEGMEGEDGVASTIESYLNKNNVKSQEKYAVAMVTSNAVSLNNDVQLIFRFFGDAAEIHKNYDFLHVTNYFTEKDGLVLNSDALEAIMSKTLKYVGSRYPICTMFRIRKFINRGWSINAGEMLKIAFDINKLDLNDINVFYEQLVGVDAAYFHQLMGMLDKWIKKNPDVELDRSYLFELINKVFEDHDFSDMEELHDEVDGE